MRKRKTFNVAVTIGSFAAVIGLGVAMGLLSWASTANAYVPPRPTVELVKIFSCDSYRSECTQDLEQQVNDWLQKNQPGMRIVDRRLTTARFRVILAIFYEVLEWRAPKGKSPAEAAPKK